MTELAERMAQLARQLRAEPDPPHLVQHVVETTRDHIAGCDSAGISLVRRRGRITTAASTDELQAIADELQGRLGEGPCLEAIWDEPLVITDDVETDERFPRWGSYMAREHGVHAMLCVRLDTHDERLGALNLFSHERGSFTDDDVQELQAIAAHAAVALAAAENIDQLNTAMVSRTTTSQAVGMIMARYEVPDHVAFDLLRTLSSEQNRKLVQIARELVDQHNAAVASRAGGARAADEVAQGA